MPALIATICVWCSEYHVFFLFRTQIFEYKNVEPLGSRREYDAVLDCNVGGEVPDLFSVPSHPPPPPHLVVVVIISHNQPDFDPAYTDQYAPVRGVKIR